MIRFSIALFLLLLVPPAFAQGGYRSIYNDFQRNAVSSFDDFTRDIRDKWERFMLQDGLERSRKPPVDSLPEPAPERPYSGRQLRVSEIMHVVDYALPLEMEAVGWRRNEQPDTSGLRHLSFDFYGAPQQLLIPSALGQVHPSGITEEAVEAYWNNLAQMDITRILAECRRLRNEAGCNDWALLQWVRQLAHAACPQDICSECTMVTVYLLNRLGLMSRMARVEDRLTILFAARQRVYGRQYVVLDTYPYYLADPDIVTDAVYTYGNAATRHTRPLDLRISEPIRLGDSARKVVHKHSSVFGETLSVPVNMSLMAFYSHYPQLEAREYALSHPDPDFKAAIVATLRPLLEGEEDIEAVNRLLAFLQKDFDYQVDVEQFGYEKPFFPEENFIYPCNDCEDRAVLLSFLTWNLLNKKMVLLDYEDHLAAAVCLEGNLKGDYVKIGGERYYVCDPSYINATVGMSMPQYRNRAVRVWVL